MWFRALIISALFSCALPEIDFLLGEQAFAGSRSGPESELRLPGAGNVQILSLKDGSTVIGRIVELGEGELRFETKMGRLTIKAGDIKSVKEVPEALIRNGQYWHPNPNRTRLFFGPTARMLNKGEAYFADYDLFFPALTVGLTDRVTIGGGMSIFPAVGLDKQIYYLTPKVKLKSIGRLDFAAGALVLKLPDNSAVVGVAYGLGTYGNDDVSVSLGLGYGFVGSHVADKPLVMLGGEKRISRRTALVTENWVVPGEGEPLVSYGVRFFGEDMSFDLAFMNLLGEDAVFPGIPYIDFVFKFR